MSSNRIFRHDVRGGGRLVGLTESGAAPVGDGAGCSELLEGVSRAPAIGQSSMICATRRAMRRCAPKLRVRPAHAVGPAPANAGRARLTMEMISSAASKGWPSLGHHGPPGLMQVNTR